MTLEELQRLRDEMIVGRDGWADERTADAFARAASEALSPTGCVTLMAAECDQFIADIATLERRNESLAAEMQRLRADGADACRNELRNQVRVLTAERDALREERDRLADTAAKLSSEQHVYCPYEAAANCMRAMLARVEALPKSWRDEEGRRDNDEDCMFSGYDCAHFLEQALKGGK